MSRWERWDLVVENWWQQAQERLYKLSSFHFLTQKHGLPAFFQETSCKKWFEKKHSADKETT